MNEYLKVTIAITALVMAASSRAAETNGAASADWHNAKEFFLVMTDAPGANAYPITATTFVLMHKRSTSPESTAIAMDFLRWSLESGQALAESLDYVPLPSELVQQIEGYSTDRAPVSKRSLSISRTSWPHTTFG